jgi:molybdenum cofactor cytidylyltransferase
MMMLFERTALVLLAAGASTRFGSAKQLALLDGEPLVRRAATAGVRAGFPRVFVVVGPLRDAIQKVLAPLPVDLVPVDGPAQLSASVRAGTLAAARWPDVDAVVLSLVDQPWVDEALLARLVHTAETHPDRAIVAAASGPVLGAPALFRRTVFDELTTLTGDEGARAIVRRDRSRVVAVPAHQAAFDIDRPEDLDVARAELASRRPPSPS